MRTPGLPGNSRYDDPALGLGIPEPEQIPQVESWTRAAGPNGEDGYGEMIARLRGFLDHVAAARLDPGTVAELAGDLGAWCERLADAAVPEREQVFGHRDDMPGRGQTTLAASRDRAALSPRETAVLRLITEGKQCDEIATELSYSERTVRYILYGAMKRLRTRNRAHAVSYAIRAGPIRVVLAPTAVTSASGNGVDGGHR